MSRRVIASREIPRPAGENAGLRDDGLWTMAADVGSASRVLPSPRLQHVGFV